MQSQRLHAHLSRVVFLSVDVSGQRVLSDDERPAAAARSVGELPRFFLPCCFAFPLLFYFPYCLSDLESSLRLVTRNGWVHCHAQRSSATALTPKRNRRYPRRRLEYSTRLVARFPIAEPVALDYNLDGNSYFKVELKREVVDSVGDKNFGRAGLDGYGAQLAAAMWRTLVACRIATHRDAGPNGKRGSFRDAIRSCTIQ